MMTCGIMGIIKSPGCRHHAHPSTVTAEKNISSYLLSSLAFAYFRANVVLMLEQLQVNVNIRTVPFDEDAQRGLIDR